MNFKEKQAFEKQLNTIIITQNKYGNLIIQYGAKKHDKILDGVSCAIKLIGDNLCDVHDDNDVLIESQIGAKEALQVLLDFPQHYKVVVELKPNQDPIIIQKLKKLLEG